MHASASTVQTKCRCSASKCKHSAGVPTLHNPLIFSLFRARSARCRQNCQISIYGKTPAHCALKLTHRQTGWQTARHGLPRPLNTTAQTTTKAVHCRVHTQCRPSQHRHSATLQFGHFPFCVRLSQSWHHLCKSLFVLTPQHQPLHAPDC